MSVGVDPALGLKRKQLLKEAKVFRPQYDNAIQESKRAQMFNAQVMTTNLIKTPAIAPLPAPSQPYQPVTIQSKPGVGGKKVHPEPRKIMSQNTMPTNQFQSQNSGPMFYQQQSMPMQGMNMSGIMQQPMMQQQMMQQPMMQQPMMQQPMMQQQYSMNQGALYQLLPQNINLQQGNSMINQRGQILGQAMQGMFQGRNFQ